MSLSEIEKFGRLDAGFIKVENRLRVALPFVRNGLAASTSERKIDWLKRCREQIEEVVREMQEMEDSCSVREDTEPACDRKWFKDQAESFRTFVATDKIARMWWSIDPQKLTAEAENGTRHDLYPKSVEFLTWADRKAIVILAGKPPL